METKDLLQVRLKIQRHCRTCLRTCYSYDSIRTLQAPQCQLYLTEIDIVRRFILQYAQCLMKVLKRVRYLLGRIDGRH